MKLKPYFFLLITLTIFSFTQSTTVTLLNIQQRGFLSQINAFYLYLHFSSPIDALMTHHTLDLMIQNNTCLTEIRLLSNSSTLALKCQYHSSYQSPILTVTFPLIFPLLTPPTILVPDQQHHLSRTLYYLPHQSLAQNYYSFLYNISQYLGYFLLFLFLTNLITYFLPLLRIIQLTSLYLILDIQKPKLLDIVLYGVFNFNKYKLYGVKLETPWTIAVGPEEYTVYDQLGVSPMFVGEQYSVLMQLCFLMMGVFVLYLVCSVLMWMIHMSCSCLKYPIKRLLKDIFINTSSLYFMMHIPLGLTSLIGIKFGKHLATSSSIIQYTINIIGSFIFFITPFLSTSLLSIFKHDLTIYLKGCYLFGNRRRRNVQTLVALELLKDVGFLGGVILVGKEYAMLGMLILVGVELGVLVKTDVFGCKGVYYLKIVEQMFLMGFTLLFVVFYVLEELGRRGEWRIGVENSIILAYVGISILGALYSIVITEIVLQFIHDKAAKWRCGNSPTTTIQTLQHDELHNDQYQVKHDKVVELKSVRKEKEKIMQKKRMGRLAQIELDGGESSQGLRRPVGSRDDEIETRMRRRGYLRDKVRGKQKTKQQLYINQIIKQKKASIFEQNPKLKSQIDKLYKQWTFTPVNQPPPSHTKLKPTQQKSRPSSSKYLKVKTVKQYNHNEITSKEAFEDISQEGDERQRREQEEDTRYPQTERRYFIENKLNLTDLEIGARSAGSERNSQHSKIDRWKVNRKGITSKFKQTK